MRRSGQALLPVILHLTRVNPHVASALPPQCSGAPPLARMARQAGGTPTCVRACTAGRAGVSGVSGFAFQGTNAHVIVTRCGYKYADGMLRQGSDKQCLVQLILCNSAADSACLVPEGSVFAAQTAAGSFFTGLAALGPSAALAPPARAPLVDQRGRRAAAPFRTASRRPRPRGTGRAAAASRGGAPAAAWCRHVRGLPRCQRHTARRATALLFALLRLAHSRLVITCVLPFRYKPLSLVLNLGHFE